MKRSTNVTVSNLSRDDILFSPFYTGLFLLFRKKTGGGGEHGPPRPLPLLRHCVFVLKRIDYCLGSDLKVLFAPDV